MGSPAREAASGGGVLGNGHFADFSLALLSCLVQDLLPRSRCGSLALMHTCGLVTAFVSSNLERSFTDFWVLITDISLLSHHSGVTCSIFLHHT